MDIGIQEITDQIASSTTSYLLTFSPLFLLVGGLILAFVIIGALLGFIPSNKRKRDHDFDVFDDVIEL